MILAAVGALAVLKADGLRVTRLRLRHEVGRIFQNFRADCLQHVSRGPLAVTAHHNPLSVERANRVVRKVGQHHLTLVDIPEPVGRKAFQQRPFAKVMSDDVSRQREQAPVISQLGSDPVHDRDRALADAMHEAGNAEQRIAPEGNRVEPLVRDAAVDDLHLFQTGNSFQKNRIVEHQKISSLNKRNAHPARQKAMLGINRTSGTGRKQHDGRFRHPGQRTQHFQNIGRGIGDRVDGGLLKRLRNDTRQRPPVLDHI